MTRWVAIFEDNPEPEVGWIRNQHAEEHFRYLAANHHKILLVADCASLPANGTAAGCR